MSSELPAPAAYCRVSLTTVNSHSEMVKAKIVCPMSHFGHDGKDHLTDSAQCSLLSMLTFEMW